MGLIGISSDGEITLQAVIIGFIVVVKRYPCWINCRKKYRENDNQFFIAVIIDRQFLNIVLSLITVLLESCSTAISKGNL